MNPSSKHQRTEEVPEVVHSDIWFEDGNLVLQAESTQFRVHRSYLTRHSKVFHDMSALPQPEDSTSVDGCLLVEMHGDTAEDWTHFLSVLYHITVVPTDGTKHPISLFRAIMHLGKKYQFDSLRKEACCRFVAQFPRSLRELEDLFSGSDCCTMDGIWHTKNAEDIISIAEEPGSGVQSVLPLAYYMALRDTFRSLTGKSIFSSPNLSANALRTLANGRSSLAADIPLDTFSWALFDEYTGPRDQMIPKSDCRTRTVCEFLRTQFLGFLFKQSAKGIGHALDPWAITMETYSFCPVCRKMAERYFEAGRRSIFKKLPTYFSLPSWIELKKLDEEALTI